MRLFKPNVKKMQKKGNIKGLLKAVDDKDSQIAYTAAKALGQIGDAGTARALIPKLENGNRLYLDEEAVGFVMTTGNIVATAIGEIGSHDIVPDLLTLLNHPDSSGKMRSGIVNALGKLKSRDALSHLVQGLQDPEEIVQRACVNALGKIGDREAIPALRNYLSKGDLKKTGQWNTIRVLYTLGDDTFLPTLKQLLFELDTCVRAARLLVKMKGADAIPDLLEALPTLVDDRREMVALREVPDFLNVIADLGDPSVIPTLVQFKRDIQPQYSGTTMYDSHTKQAAREKIDKIVKQLEQQEGGK